MPDLLWYTDFTWLWSPYERILHCERKPSNKIMLKSCFHFFSFLSSLIHPTTLTIPILVLWLNTRCSSLNALQRHVFHSFFGYGKTEITTKWQTRSLFYHRAYILLNFYLIIKKWSLWVWLLLPHQLNPCIE